VPAGSKVRVQGAAAAPPAAAPAKED
jgi:hypothetical protein